ncbi:hypothetical protein IMX26_13070 [Clostridium sp. 'deep sea']|uniref:hypothetical protein n=1 Tax=Clostridium sp. 'deep sea' TaxID=2779445 RepID=UPI0018967B8D|nr:hypothetical protein [Clostridium sp. 'deep sea']QOR34417.1 hypothetical protein IMX26_13070 [Clostridium sp. 'deep sea']
MWLVVTCGNCGDPIYYQHHGLFHISLDTDELCIECPKCKTEHTFSVDVNFTLKVENRPAKSLSDNRL